MQSSHSILQVLLKWPRGVDKSPCWWEQRGLPESLMKKKKSLFCTQLSEMLSNAGEQRLLCGWTVTIKSLETVEKWAYCSWFTITSFMISVNTDPHSHANKILKAWLCYPNSSKMQDLLKSFCFCQLLQFLLQDLQYLIFFLTFQLLELQNMWISFIFNFKWSLSPSWLNRKTCKWNF